MKVIHFVLIFIAVSIPSTNSGKILAISFFSLRSHKLTYQPLIEELANRGHQVTFITPVKPTKEVKNLREIFTFDVDTLLRDHVDIFEYKEAKKEFDPYKWFMDVWSEHCKTIYDDPRIKGLLNETFDLVFIPILSNDCALGYAYSFNAPIVLFTQFGAPNYITSKVGGYMPSSFVPRGSNGVSDEMGFFQRFKNFGSEVLFEMFLAYRFEPVMEAVYRGKLRNDDIPSVAEIVGNASLILSNTHFSISRPKPYLPNVIDVGGIHSRPAKALPKDLEDFVMKSGKDGFILFSMGSAIIGDKMPENKRQMFINVFSKLKQRVLWKWESETMPDLPKNVKLSKWLPQQDLLGHPNIKMFITHCGGGGLEESVYHGVPLVGIPFFGDQPLNSKQAQSHGFLIELDWSELTEEKLLNAINDILLDSKYRDNVKRLSTIFKDQIDDPLQRAVYWVEYVMRHKGAQHLKSAARKLNYFQYHSWDVIAAYTGIVLAVLKLTYSLLYLMLNKICCVLFKKTVKTDRKSKEIKKKN